MCIQFVQAVFGCACEVLVGRCGNSTSTWSKQRFVVGFLERKVLFYCLEILPAFCILVYLTKGKQNFSSPIKACFSGYGMCFNLLAPELFFLVLAHTVYKMWIIQEPNTLELWNKLYFEEKETESIYHV